MLTGIWSAPRALVRRARLPRPSPWAAVPLLAVLGHLVVMASSLHAAAAHADHAASLQVASGELDGHCDGCGPPGTSAAGDRSDHCALEWATLPNRLSVHLVEGPPVSLSTRGWANDALRPHAAARALGPPEPTDVQAYLQVFRI